MSGIIAQNAGRHTGLVKVGGAGGVWNLILTQTASASATINFTSGLDSTYDEYVFMCINLHPATDSQNLNFQGSIDTGSNYNVAITSTHFQARHDEADGGSHNHLDYQAGRDLAQGTGYQRLTETVGNAADSSASGFLHLYAPADTTFVKHFMWTSNCMQDSPLSVNSFCAGYFNTTSAIDAISFKYESGNITGQISLYGIS